MYKDIQGRQQMLAHRDKFIETFYVNVAGWHIVQPGIVFSRSEICYNLANSGENSYRATICFTRVGEQHFIYVFWFNDEYVDRASAETVDSNENRLVFKSGEKYTTIPTHLVYMQMPDAGAFMISDLFDIQDADLEDILAMNGLGK